MAFTNLTTFTVVTCYKCSVLFGMPSDMQTRLLRDGGDFWCPNGHGQVYAEPEVKKLQKQLNTANNDTQYWRQRQLDEEAARQRAERVAANRKGQVTKIKKRISNGVCPCCNRTFQDVQKHMASKHPEYAEHN